jgi:hypothetical protein
MIRWISVGVGVVRRHHYPEEVGLHVGTSRERQLELRLVLRHHALAAACMLIRSPPALIEMPPGNIYNLWTTRMLFLSAGDTRPEPHAVVHASRMPND